MQSNLRKLRTMTQSSPILSLPYLQPSQAQKHVTHNEALDVLDSVVQLSVLQVGATVPPAAPTEGEAHIPGAGATAAWAGHDNEIAVWRDGLWVFTPPLTGWLAWDQGTARLRVWDGAGWDYPQAASDNLAGLGIATSADATNVLSVAGPATLLSHSGAGHQVKVNKSGAGDTASLLFQSGWTGHAEMGLAGSTDFTVKVSGNGSTWNTGLAIKAGTGRAGFGVTIPTARVTIRETGSAPALRAEQGEAGFTGSAFEVVADRTGGPGFELARFSSGGGADAEFVFSGDGNGACDGSWTGGGADYAEYFEWADGNPEDEDRRGLAVVLEGACVRPARAGEDPIGVVSGNPSVIGDGDASGWKGRYLRDAFGTPLTETVEMLEWEEAGETHRYAADTVPMGIEVPAGAARLACQRRVVNPAFDPQAHYTPRNQRPEWAVIGLTGKLRLRTGQPTGARWQQMRSARDGIEEWLVR